MNLFVFFLAFLLPGTLALSLHNIKVEVKAKSTKEDDDEEVAYKKKADTEWLPGSDLFSLGFNPTTQDLRMPIFNSYDALGKTTAVVGASCKAEKCVVPAFMFVRDEEVGDITSETKLYKSERDFLEAQAQAVSGNLEIPVKAVAVSGDLGYKSTDEKTEVSGETGSLAVTTINVQVFRAFNRNLPNTLSKSFIRAVEAAKDANEKDQAGSRLEDDEAIVDALVKRDEETKGAGDPIVNLYRNFGCYFVREAQFGGQLVIMSKLKKSNTASGKATVTEVNAAVGTSVGLKGGAGVSASSSHKNEDSITKELAKSVSLSSTTARLRGGNPGAYNPSDVSEWIRSVRDHPVMFDTTLAKFTDLTQGKAAIDDRLSRQLIALAGVKDPSRLGMRSYSTRVDSEDGAVGEEDQIAATVKELGITKEDPDWSKFIGCACSPTPRKGKADHGGPYEYKGGADAYKRCGETRSPAVKKSTKSWCVVVSAKCPMARRIKHSTVYWRYCNSVSNEVKK